jgi:hypothetical protein
VFTRILQDFYMTGLLKKGGRKGRPYQLYFYVTKTPAGAGLAPALA